ncbi:hypothetical protein KKF91_05745 [Myxococcota bacterium]|nr:hypothetical protein [Myxococcota bacterium]MBU1430053.1 hypothetical protein [Myxococcota bacterium]MBU1896421.1 hypothetical protein [Myxococcota bacterium]
MCRYAFGHYKPHYACFDCRKGFKRRLRSDFKGGGEALPARCPQCGALMANMGLDFKPPPMKDACAWRVLQGLYTAGLTFHSCGCSGPGYRPRSPQAYQRFLEETRAGYLSALRRWVSDQDAAVEARAEAIASWRARLARVEAALADA